MIRVFFVIFWGLLAAPLMAQETPHDIVKTGLIYLQASGTAGKEGHPKRGVKGGVISQGTGFFVGKDGFILTTRHFLDPLEKAEARQVSITASIGGASSDDIPVQIASELDRVDLLLLKANMPFDKPPPNPLRIGRTSKYNRASPTALFTSGFHGETYRRKEVEFNASESADFPYAWTVNVKTNSGQSGSPVYDADGSVLGIVKATASEDDELTLMIPIDYAMPLIGHLEIDRLNERVELLMDVIGELTRDDPPLHLRLKGIEDNLTELSNRFTWSAFTAPDGTLRIRYEKLIGGGAQVDGIRINVRPYMRFLEDNGGTSTQPIKPLKLTENGSGFFDRKELDEEERVGEFLIPNVETKLVTLKDVLGNVSQDEPYRDLEVTIIPTVGEKTLDTKKLTVVPTFEWK
ncbi:serine protease [Roseobacter sp. YSTF-M11]|uniref:Serine protease n=1 Tax=Roseobacter insulae TaxID=2859783 RepID=A0A9X1FZ28_9RHOB|nr:serine protease [Roseobacter insulae]MBW4709969.1 serine protease [Roseobacter insulae]